MTVRAEKEREGEEEKTERVVGKKKKNRGVEKRYSQRECFIEEMKKGR